MIKRVVPLNTVLLRRKRRQALKWCHIDVHLRLSMQTRGHWAPRYSFTHLIERQRSKAPREAPREDPLRLETNRRPKRPRNAASWRKEYNSAAKAGQRRVNADEKYTQTCRSILRAASASNTPQVATHHKPGSVLAFAARRSPTQLLSPMFLSFSLPHQLAVLAALVAVAHSCSRDIVDSPAMTATVATVRSAYLASRPNPFDIFNTVILVPQANGTWLRGGFNMSEVLRPCFFFFGLSHRGASYRVCIQRAPSSLRTCWLLWSGASPRICPSLAWSLTFDP
jgi:hypothetical protein